MGQQSISSSPVRVLSISPCREDHTNVRHILGHSKWILDTADGLKAAIASLERHNPSVVICECDLKPGNWTDVLDHTNRRPHPPSVVVASRLADERLWSEILNRGAWDLLAKPFDRVELIRSIRSAWEHWRNQIEGSRKPLHVMAAAG